MKISKYLLIGLAALTLASCEKDDPTFANYIPPKGGTEDPGKTEEGPEIPAGAVKAEVTIDRNTTYQTIAGFGASDCWAPAFVGKNWTSCRDEIATLLFDQSASGATTRGIGLSMWRVNLGAGSYEQGSDSKITANRRAESFRTGTTDYDWSKCEGQQFFMQKARDMGVESFVLFSNSPLVQYTYNRKAFSARGAKNANLRPANYAAFADYMAEVAAHFKAEGYNVTHISPFNEPQYDWGAGSDGNASQEGSGWSVAQQVQLVRELDKALTNKGIDVNILPGEAANWTELYSSDNILSNYFTAGGANYIGDLAHLKNNLVCAHSYWTDYNWNDMRNVRSQVASAAAQYGADVWQTEWSMLGNDQYAADEFPGYSNFEEMDVSIHMSRVIHNDLTLANVTSWSFWTSMDGVNASHRNRFILIGLVPDGADYTDGDGTYNPTTNLWVLGNYSLCIRPGFVRVDAKVANESAQFFGSSYLSPDNTRLVSVYTNNTEGTFYLQDEFEGRDQIMSIKTYTTNADNKLTPANVRVKDVVTIPAKSVVTVVYDL